jgi:hypothetical protein
MENWEKYPYGWWRTDAEGRGVVFYSCDLSRTLDSSVVVSELACVGHSFFLYQKIYSESFRFTILIKTPCDSIFKFLSDVLTTV